MIILRDYFDNVEVATIRSAYMRFFKEKMPTIKTQKGRKAGACGVLLCISKDRAKILCDNAEYLATFRPYNITPFGLKLYRRLREIVNESNF